MKYINPCSSFRVLRAILLVACLFFSIGVHAQDSQRPALVKFATAPIAPYQVVGEGGKLIGSALPVIECIMRNLEIPYTVDVFPWGRAQQNVELGDHDAFFVASQNRVRDSYAQLSEPLFAGTRSWVFRKGEGEDPESLLKRFQNTMQRSGILRELRNRRFFRSKGEQARLDRQRSLRRIRRRRNRA